MITHFLCEDFNCWPCNVVEDKHDLDSNTNQDSILQSPKEASKKCGESRNQIQLWKFRVWKWIVILHFYSTYQKNKLSWIHKKRFQTLLLNLSTKWFQTLLLYLSTKLKSNFLISTLAGRPRIRRWRWPPWWWRPLNWPLECRHKKASIIRGPIK